MNTWILQDPGGVEIRKFAPASNQPAGLANLIRTVVMTFVQLDDAGMPSGADPHVYTEPIVHDVSDVGIARLVRDQLRQLNVIEASSIGVVADLSPIKALVTPPVPEPPTAEEQAELAAADAKRASVLQDLQKQRQLAAAVDLGLLREDDVDVLKATEKLKAAIADDASLVLSVLG